MNDLKVTAGMAEAADIGHLEDGIAAALAHPDFRAQVAELMRGMAPEHSDCRHQFLSRIAEWESAK